MRDFGVDPWDREFPVGGRVRRGDESISFKPHQIPALIEALQATDPDVFAVYIHNTPGKTFGLEVRQRQSFERPEQVATIDGKGRSGG